MFGIAKILHTHGFYNFDPIQLYLVETNKLDLALRLEWYGNGLRIVDHAILGIENIEPIIEMLENGERGVKITIATNKGQLVFNFSKKLNGKVVAYKGSIIYRYYGFIPVSINSFRSKLSSIKSLLKDIDENTRKLQTINKIM